MLYVLIRVAIVVMLVSIAVLIIIWITGDWKHGENKTLINICVWGIAGPIIAAVAFVLLYSCGAVLYFFHKNLEVAFEPIPSPAEIEHQLRLEGYNPTLSDVMAVHQMLVSRRNQAAAGAALTFGAIHVMNRQASGKPVL